MSLLVASADLRAQSPEGREDAVALEDVVVSTTRTDREQKQLPESVTVIGREQIENQSRYTDDLGEIAANLVPGLGESSENLTNTGQNLRGRDFLVLIDGVPQNASLRQASKFLRTIAPEAVERIEVIRGSVATHGLGATGGIVHFITKSGEGLEEPEARTTVELTGQEDDSESFGGRIYQGLAGSTDRIDYSLNLSAKKTGVHYDGEGDVIPADGLIQGGSLSENDAFNIQTKLNYDLKSDQDVELAFNYYDRLQDASYRADRTTGNNNPNRKVEAESGSPRGESTGTENTNLSLTHTWSDLYEGKLETQVYYQDYETQYSYYAAYPSGGGQSQVLTDHSGLRMTYNRGWEPLGDVIYGLDYDRENTEQNLLDGRTRTGEMTESTVAPFVQAEVPFGENWSLRAGVRHEDASIDVPTFQDETGTDPATVRGATLEYSETLFNAGAVYYLTDRQNLFAGYSEGFSIGDVGRALRGISQPPASVEADAIDPQAQVVENFEFGWRFTGQRADANISTFLSTSDLGSTFEGPPDFEIKRRKEEVYGIELSGEFRPTERTTYGGSATWQDGEEDTDNDGSLDETMPSTRITPPRVTAHVEHELSHELSSRLQGKYLFDRDPNNDGSYPDGAVNGYGLLNGSLEKSFGDRSTLTFSVRNLLDEQYIVPVAQAWNLPNRMVAGKGRSFSLKYSTQF